MHFSRLGGRIATRDRRPISRPTLRPRGDASTKLETAVMKAKPVTKLPTDPLLLGEDAELRSTLK